jgi:hypothetical protein
VWLLCFRPPARLLPRRGQNRDGAPGCEVQEMRTRWRSFVSPRGFLLGGENKMTAEAERTDPTRARASTGWDTPSSGGASVPSRIRPESTVREITQPVSLALSSSTPSDANDRVGSRVSAMRARARPGRSEPERARVAKHAERRARVLPLDVLRCAHLLARAVRSMRRARSRRPPSAVLD